MAPLDTVAPVAHSAEMVGDKLEQLAGMDAFVPGDILEVVGGASSGGIIVRTGKDKTSSVEIERLSKGSFVKALEVDTGRLSYELLSGSGPAGGWVSFTASGRALLVKAGTGLPAADVKIAQEALHCYSRRLAEAREAGKGDFILNRNPFSMVSEKETDTSSNGDSLLADLEVEAAVEDSNARKSVSAGASAIIVKDSDGEAVMLCHQCHLPLGDFGYGKHEKSKCLFHAECMAHVMLHERQLNEDARKSKEAELKKSRREEYDIGWKVATIPSNIDAATKLGCGVIPQGLCCLVLQGEDSVRIAPTFEPAGALNLEYLSIALQVRRVEGREPLFSLDPIQALQDTFAPEASMQAKRFVPEWIAGTSVGEVMFQADYHLKELSMGEHKQPIIGMKSCFDLAKHEGFDQDWSAREWFVVRKAEMHVSEDSVLVPYLKMGVEAREQLMLDGSLEDAPLTRPDHPLVKYAEAFTHNFDLIAERKSVVSQLREVAKASIVAKFMMEAGVQLQEAWFKLGEPKDSACCLEVPQLWNDRCFSKVHIKDGSIVASEQTNEAKVHSVYGGVDFGIDRFRLAAPSRIATSVVAGRAALGRPSSTLMATSQAGLAAAPSRQFTRLAAPLSARATLTAPSRLAAPLSARAGLAAPLSAMAAARPATSLMATSRLSMGAPQARLAAPLRASMAAPSRLAAPLTARAGLAAPLSAMAAARPATSLMATSRLSVGAPQARLAAPLSAMAAARPASSLMATSRISMAAPQVATARLSAGMPRGVDLNLDKFNLSAAVEVGTWAGTIEAPEGAENLSLCGDMFLSNLKTGVSSALCKEDRTLLAGVFHPQLSDRQEEGKCFLPPPTSLTYMHRLKMLVKEEAAVMQKRKEHFFSTEFVMENVGPLFPASWSSSIEVEGQTAAASEKFFPLPAFSTEIDGFQEALNSSVPVFEKYTEDGTRFMIYRLGSLEVRATQEVGGKRVVGAIFAIGAPMRVAAGGVVATQASKVLDDDKLSKVTEYVESAPEGALRCRFYVVFTTEGGHTIVTEQLADGTIAWLEDPDGLDARNCLAKELRKGDCRGTVRDLRAFGAAPLRPGGALGKNYAKAVYGRTCIEV